MTSALALALLADSLLIPDDGAASWLQRTCCEVDMHLCTSAAGARDVSGLPEQGQVAEEVLAAVESLPLLLQGDAGVGSMLFTPGVDGTGTMVNPHIPPGSLILPGSFNPLHSGHEAMLQAAVQVATGDDTDAFPVPFSGLAVFEMSATNVDKPPLAEAEVARRVEQFTGCALPGHEASPTPPQWPSGHAHRSGEPQAVLVTDAPLFAQKAALLPGSYFVLGMDTAARLLQGKYYAGGEAGMLVALGGLLHAGTRFLVAGRRADAVGGTGRFLALQDLEVPPPLADLFVPIPQELFASDVSSSQLRAAAGADASEATAPA